MSTIYHTEPPTQGKVLIKTSQGDIDIELWTKEAPLACRNFIQLILEGYYDNTLVHRVIKGFMVQMGDHTGSGTGGSSIWGRPFKDELHGRIKFNHRGQVAMANENKPHTNQSQFFITLDACEWLNRKHTIFGKVTGSTVFNVLRMGECEVGEDDRPIESIKILSCEVLWNPFDDIIPRTIVANSNEAEARTGSKDSKKGAANRAERKGTKDKKLLSFGEDKPEDEAEAFDGNNKVKMRSLHDSKLKDKKLSSKVPDTLLSDAKAGDNVKKNATQSSIEQVMETEVGGEEEEDGNKDFDAAMRRQMMKRRMAFEQRTANSRQGRKDENESDEGEEEMKQQSKSRSGKDTEEGLGAMLLESQHSQRQADLQKKAAEYSKLRNDLLRSRRAVSVLTGEDAVNLQKETAFKEMISPLEQRRMKYLKRKQVHGDRDTETMEKLQQFAEKIRSKKSEQAKKEKSLSAPAESDAFYHGQVLEKDSDHDSGSDTEWHAVKLKFKKHVDDGYRNKVAADSATGADGRLANDYAVFDPRKLR